MEEETQSHKGRRFDVVAVSMLPDLSRSYVATLIQAGSITVSGRTEKLGYKLKVDDTVDINVDLKTLQTIPDIELPVIYEDDNVIVINKPAGIISHSRGRYWYEPSVASFVRQKTNQEGDRAGIVHRLDRVTSGVMICAKNQETMTMLQKQFADRKVQKVYSAVVFGHLKEPRAKIDMPIERNPKAPATFRVGTNGKPSVTFYEVIHNSEHYDLVELTPQTGRTHQLRVHLKQLGHPIIGDHLYDGKSYERLLLHAKELHIAIPEHGIKTFAVPNPPEFEEILLKDGGVIS